MNNNPTCGSFVWELFVEEPNIDWNTMRLQLSIMKMCCNVFWWLICFVPFQYVKTQYVVSTVSPRNHLHWIMHIHSNTGKRAGLCLCRIRHVRAWILLKAYHYRCSDTDNCAFKYLWHIYCIMCTICYITYLRKRGISNVQYLHLFLRTVNKKVIVAVFYNLIPIFGQYIGAYLICNFISSNCKFMSHVVTSYCISQSILKSHNCSFSIIATL